MFTTARDVNKTTWPTLVISCVRSEQDGLLVYQSRAAQRARQLFTTARDVNKTTWPTLVISCVRSEQDGLLVYQSRAAQRARQLFTTARDVNKVHNLVHKVVHKVIYIRQVSYTIDLDVRNVGSSKHC